MNEIPDSIAHSIITSRIVRNCPICTWSLDRVLPYEDIDDPRIMRWVDEYLEEHLRHEHGLMSVATHENEVFEECRKAVTRATAEAQTSPEYRLGKAAAELLRDTNRSLDWDF